MSIFAKIFALILAVLAFFGCSKIHPAPTPKPNSYDTDGNTVEFRFDANPSTGFEWKAEIDGNCIVFTDSKYISDKNPGNMVGVGGLQYFYFAAVSAGTATITFTYYRPFEDMGNDRVFVAQISVDENNNISITEFYEKTSE